MAFLVPAENPNDFSDVRQTVINADLRKTIPANRSKDPQFTPERYLLIDDFGHTTDPTISLDLVNLTRVISGLKVVVSSRIRTAFDSAVLHTPFRVGNPADRAHRAPPDRRRNRINACRLWFPYHSVSGSAHGCHRGHPPNPFASPCGKLRVRPRQGKGASMDPRSSISDGEPPSQNGLPAG